MNHIKLTVETTPKSIQNITSKIENNIQQLSFETGICHLFVQHTSCSLIISENADPDVLIDLENTMSLIVQEKFPYRHNCEGPDDMPAHFRSVLTQTTLTIPIINAQLALGTWQAVYLWEHRTRAHSRHIILSLQS